MRVGVLGGTFDPIHIGHLRLAIEAMEQLHLKEVVLEVTRVSPFKVSERITDPEIRYAMVVEAVRDVPGLLPGRTDFNLPSPSYTIETLRIYFEKGLETTLLMGSDTLAGFMKWKEPEKILEISRLGVVERLNYPCEEVLASLPDWVREKVDSFEMPHLEVSSTLIRKKISQGLSVTHLVPQSVVKIIEEHRLYKE
ncbi:MAG TPA: nicotinate-nucleotide adenylyltransferase [Fimbriimonadales bacterium]|nr:nicotinate-nucleotide adenylyltransferase [Fimbriimonadales bacterium]